MPQTPRTVVVIGDALIDEIHDEGGVRELVGGAALNVAVGVRRLGLPTTLIAMVGNDEAGDHIREYLSDHDVALISTPAPHGSSRAVVQKSAGGEPEYVFNRAAKERSIQYGPEAVAALAAASVVAVSCFPFDVPAEVDALAAALGTAPLAIDPNPRLSMLKDRAEFVRGFERLVPGAAIVKVGADDAALLYDGDLDALRDRLRTLGATSVVATAGSEGAMVSSDAGLVTSPISALTGPIVDTVGAGDATLAAVVAGVADGLPASTGEWQRVLDHAMQIAAATCRAEGGLLRTPEGLADATRGAQGS